MRGPVGRAGEPREEAGQEGVEGEEDEDRGTGVTWGEGDAAQRGGGVEH